MFFITTTLADKVSKDFSRVIVGKTIVKVPRIHFRRISTTHKPDPDGPINLVVRVLLRNAVKRVRLSDKGTITKESEKDIVLSKASPRQNIHGGYGSLSAHYGSAPSIPYVDYGKIFSYLGKFKSQSSYENLGKDEVGWILGPDTNSSTIATRETMDKGAKYIKYFKPAAVDIYSSISSLVPVAGMSSGEWEEFKLLMQLDKVMFRLKTSTV